MESTNDIFRFILEVQKQQLLYTHKLHGWLIAINETLQQRDPEFRDSVRAHRFYTFHEEGPGNVTVVVRNIEALLQQLEENAPSKVRPFPG